VTPIDFNGLDTAVHGPIRLGAMVALRIDGKLDFTTLKKRLNVTDGSLGVHLHKLEDKGYVKTNKRFVGRRPKTTYQLTASGRKALKGYLDTMQRLLDAIGSPARNHEHLSHVK
jgi:DNA-binding PadR family transcriptional regulator